MIHGELGETRFLTAVLTSIMITQEDIIPRESNDVFACSVVSELDQPDHERHFDRDRDRTDLAIRSFNDFDFAGKKEL